jgi:hypothetical protein
VSRGYLLMSGCLARSGANPQLKTLPVTIMTFELAQYLALRRRRAIVQSIIITGPIWAENTGRLVPESRKPVTIQVQPVQTTISLLLRDWCRHMQPHGVYVLGLLDRSFVHCQ